MSCHQADEWLDAYLDGELDLGRSLEIEDHLNSCGDCRAARDTYKVLQRSLQVPGVYFQAPGGLEGRIRTRLRAASGQKRRMWTPKIDPEWRWVSVAAAIAAALILVILSVDLLRRPSQTELLAQQVVSSHVRSLMGNHLMDVPSSDQHTVKPWFNGKLDFAPVVKDLASDGYPLVGGRLDYLDGRPVAALLYKRRQHTINLFEWPTSHSDSRPEGFVVKGYSIIRWTRSGMTYWAISDLNAGELTDFARDEER